MSYDVAIVGLGTAGAAAAAFCARRGLKVIGLERRARGEAGARWVNGVPAWVFDEVRLAPPRPPERRGGEHAFHLVVGYNIDRRITIRDTGVLEVDMRSLGDRLWAEAERHGATLRDGVRVTGFDGETLSTSDGPVSARWYVDASGLGGHLGASPRTPKTALCAAAQFVHEVSDPTAAAEFLHRHRAREGEVVCFTGVEGGYSILNVRIDRGEVSVLTGSIPAWGHRSGIQMVRDFAARNPFVGASRFGGARAIPLAPPPATVASDRVAVIGDAAGQVHAVHGSGIGQQLLAAEILAQTFAAGAGPEGYNVEWQRKRAGYLAWSTLFCRFSQQLELSELDRLVANGAMHAGVMGQVLVQRPPRPAPRALAKAVLGLVKTSGVRTRLIGVIGRHPVVAAHYARYPKRPEDREAWVRMTRRLLT